MRPLLMQLIAHNLEEKEYLAKANLEETEHSSQKINLVL